MFVAASGYNRYMEIKLLTTQQVADMLGKDARTIRHHAQTGKLKAFRVGRDWLFEPEEIERYKAEARKRKVKEKQDETG